MSNKIAIMVGALSTGFGLRYLVDDSGKADSIVKELLSKGTMAEAVVPSLPSSVNPRQKNYSSGDHFVTLGGGVGNGVALIGPFPDHDTAEEFAEASRADGDEWAIFVAHEKAQQEFEVTAPVANAESEKNGLLDASGEVVVVLKDDWTMRSGVYDQDAADALTSGEYVRICMPDGTEYAYWDKDEWAKEPALVMGAIINSAAGLRMEDLDVNRGASEKC